MNTICQNLGRRRLHIKSLDSEGCFFVLEDPKGWVSFNLPGYISMEADGLQQMFRNPRNATYKDLERAYPSEEAILKSAECFTEGITNKSKFLQVIHNKEFCKKHNITEHDQTVLKEFITRHNYKPPTVIQQLYMKGYGRFAEQIDFADPMSQLTYTCKVFQEFIRTLKQVPLSEIPS